MKTKLIEYNDLQKRLFRNEAFWRGELTESPLMWVSVPEAKKGTPPPKPATNEEMWTDVKYYVEKTEYDLSHTYFAGDSLPVCHPWLGPDQFSAWLGAEMIIKPHEFTSWVTPFITDLEHHKYFKIDKENKWWKLYLDLLKACAEAGKDKWITAYPDLHTGIDALCAIRGPGNLMMDIMTSPDAIKQAMFQMTDLWKYVVDSVAGIIEPYGQGSSNWTLGWSSKKFLCVGQNDFSCLIGPDMFTHFCLHDNIECTQYVDYSIYHLDGAEAIRHLPTILGLKKLTTVQWIQGAGNPEPSKWLDLLHQIQKEGKSVQLWYDLTITGEIDMIEEVKILCKNLDKTRLFICAVVDSVEKADNMIKASNK